MKQDYVAIYANTYIGKYLHQSYGENVVHNFSKYAQKCQSDWMSKIKPYN